MTNNKNVLFTTGHVRCFLSHLSPTNLPRGILRLKRNCFGY